MSTGRPRSDRWTIRQLRAPAARRALLRLEVQHDRQQRLAEAREAAGALEEEPEQQEERGPAGQQPVVDTPSQTPRRRRTIFSSPASLPFFWFLESRFEPPILCDGPSIPGPPLRSAPENALRRTAHASKALSQPEHRGGIQPSAHQASGSGSGEAGTRACERRYRFTPSSAGPRA